MEAGPRWDLTVAFVIISWILSRTEASGRRMPTQTNTKQEPMSSEAQLETQL